VPLGINRKVAKVFDTVLGLPVHALVVHGVVVLLPFMAVLTAVVACIPSWRLRFAWLVAVVDAGMVAMTLVAKESGEALQTRLGGQIARDHAALGQNLVWFAVALFAASVVVALVRRSDKAVFGGVLAVVVGVLALWWTVRVGHSGSEAVWKGVVNATNPR